MLPESGLLLPMETHKPAIQTGVTNSPGHTRTGTLRRRGHPM